MFIGILFIYIYIGEFLKEGKAGISYVYVTTPKLVPIFLQKDNKNKIMNEYSAVSVSTDKSKVIKIGSVAAGKNHSICIEDWESQGTEDGVSSSEKREGEILRGVFHNYNRVFTWGFGGYGRLGHAGVVDEYRPREVGLFTPLNAQVCRNPQKRIRKIYGGSAFTIALAESGSVYYWGMISNASRGEATVYPKMVEELYDWVDIHAVGVGSNAVVVSTRSNKTAAWGIPVAGKWGFEDGVKGSRVPKYLEKLCGYDVLEIGCGFGHICFILNEPINNNNTTDANVQTSNSNTNNQKRIQDMPVLPLLDNKKRAPSNSTVTVDSKSKKAKSK